MNHIFRLVWNRRLGVFQVASEFARGRTKGGRSADGGMRRAAWLAGVPLSLPLWAWAAALPTGVVAERTAATASSIVAANALPTGGQVTSGAGQLSQHGNTLTVTQQSQNLSLNWQTFNIGSQSTVDFVQPGASAIAVNRIADTRGSQILGHLNANGQVFLINPNGILFGKGAQVNVGGLVASTLDVGDEALGSSTLTFSGTGKGSVINLGTINVTGGGYAALLGNQVGNQGAIHAQLGSVALAGGSAVTLNFGGNKLVSVQVDKSTLDALAQNGQLIEANGGHVWMTAGARDSLLASAVNNTGTIEAQTVQNQNGHIMLMGGMEAGAVTVGGTLDASAPHGGNGGQIETSAAKVNVADTAKITTAAQLGLTGTWLIDPHDFTIAPNGGNITGAALSGALTSGSVTIESSASSTGGSGNVNVNDNVSWNANALTLTAANNVNVNATMTASGTAGLVVNTATTNGSDAAVAGGTLNMGLGGSGFAGRVNFTGAGQALTINGTPYTIVTTLGVAGDGGTTTLQGIKNNLSGHYALGADINASVTSSWNSGAGFTPIGGGNAGTAFSGVFEGLGHTISGLYINYNATGSAAGVGLFGASSGVIRNVGVSGSVSAGGSGTAIGGLVGASYGTVVNDYSAASVSGSSSGVRNWVGGLVGCNACNGFGDTPIYSASGRTVTGGTIANAFATGSVHGLSNLEVLGGLAGTNYGSISNAYATGAVIASYGGGNPANDNLGGLVGNNYGTITNAYATGNVSFGPRSNNNQNFLGGLVGNSAAAGSTGAITDTYATGTVSSPDSSDIRGGLIGQLVSGPVTSSYWNTTNNAAPGGASVGVGAGAGSASGISGLTTPQMEQANNFSGWSIATTGGQGLTWRNYLGYTTPLIESLLIPLTINASNQTVTYNGTNQFAAAVSSSLASPNYSYITAPGLTAAQHAGSYSESLASAYSYNYDLTIGTPSATLTINPATLTPTLTNSGVIKTYDGTTNAPTGFTPTYGYSGLIAGDSVTLAKTGVAYNSAHVASATSVTVSGLSIASIAGSNGSLVSDYALASSNVSAAASITPMTLTASLSNAANTTKTYDGTTAAPVGFMPTYTITGLLAGDSASVSSSAAAVFNSAHVASATTITQGGLSLSSVTGNGSDNSVLSDYTLASTTASTGVGVANITPWVLTVTAPTISGTLTKVYDGTTAAPGASLIGGSISGALSGDSLSLNDSGITLAYNSSHVASANSIHANGSLTLGILSSTNGSQSTDYSLLPPTIASVAGTITPAELTIGLSNTTNVTKTYDGTTTAPAGFAPTYSISGLISGDSASVSSSATPVFNSAHVASAADITQGGLSLVSVTGNGSDNSVLGDYALSSTTARTGVGMAGITPRTLTVSAPTIGGVATKVYDGTLFAPGASLVGGSISGALSGDSLSLDTSGVTLAYNSSHAASASSISASGSLAVNIGSSTNGSQSTDYSVILPTIAPVAGTITPAPLIATLVNSGVTKTYDGTTHAPTGFTPVYTFNGLASGDTNASLVDTGELYNSAHVAGATNLTASGLGITGIVGSNGSQVSDYLLVSTSVSVAASITPAMLTAILANSGVTKVYDGTTAAPAGFTPTYNYIGLVSGDTGASLADTGAGYNSAHVAGATDVTVSGLSISSITGSSGSQTSDYTLASSNASVAATITPAMLTATLTNSGVTKTYDGTTAAPAGFAAMYNVSGLIAGDTGASLTDTGAAYDSAHVASATSLTVSGLAIGGVAGSHGSQASDYALTSSNANVAATITPAPLTVSLLNTGITKTYDGTTAAPVNFSPMYGFSGLVSGDSATVGSAATPVFNSAHVASASTITQGGLSLQSITGNGSDNSVLGDYTLVSTSAYGAASITPATLTASLTNRGVTKIYDGTAATPPGFMPVYSYIGLITGDTSATLGDTGAAYNSAHVASATDVSVSGLSINGITGGNGSQASDYMLASTSANVAATITPATLTASLTNSGVTKTYDGTTAAPAGFAPTYSYGGFATGDTGATLGDTGASYNSAHVASATSITVSGLSIGSISGSDGSQASDYSLASTSANVAATITPATLTASLANRGVTKVYDGTTSAPIGFTPIYSYSGLVSGDTGASLSDTGAAYNSSQVANATDVTVTGLGIGSIVGSVGSLASDYALASRSASVAAGITPAALTASLTGPISKVYDGTTAATLASGNYLLRGFVSGQGATVTLSSGTYNSSNVASATSATATLVGGDFVADSGTNLSNYILPISASGAASITPASLLVTANNAGKAYDGLAYTGGPGVLYSGFVNGEGASALGGALNYGGNSQGAVNAGLYTITPMGLSSGNYTISYRDGLLTVSPALLTAELTGTAGKAYDGTTTATLTSGNYTLIGVVGNDAVSLNDPGTGTYATANAGSGIGVQVGGLAISGNGAGNYILGNSTASAAIGTITPAPLTVTASNASTIYNAKAYSGGNGVTYSGFVDGQTASVLGGALIYGGNSQGAMNVGNYALTPGGLSSGNYAITYDSGTLSISPATLTYIATPMQVYNGQAIPPLTGTVTGFQGSDTLANATTGTPTFATPATAQSPVGQYAINGNGLAANDGNYVFVQAAGNALALNVAPGDTLTLPGVAYMQQQLGQPAAVSLLVSTTAAPDEASSEAVPLRSVTPAAAPDLYTPDVRVVGGGVRLP
ncbi:YDG domain-containing protein [Dyella japonica]|uniref:YDG domain-containing protein n=1 Tax=Dyella japonica TaxID=231455 RepID=UPI000381A1E5|nr:YDG domain-containing protein [Dyella japonica]